MSRNAKQISARVAKLAAETLQDSSASQVSRLLAAAAIAQRSTSKQTGADMEELAARVLASDHHAQKTKELAAPVLAKSNK